MAITRFGSVGVPTDNGTSAVSPVAFANPPIASMVAGDLVVVIAYCRNAAATIAVSNAGGQTWTSETAHQSSTATLTARVFWCRYNGTWSAAPSFSFSSTTNTNVVMHVFRPTTGSNLWGKDPIASGGLSDNELISYAAPGTSLVQINNFTPLNNSNVTVYIWVSEDDNTWNPVGGGAGSPAVTAITSPSAQFRNTSGNDVSSAYGYLIQTTAATVGAPTGQQVTNGGDAGIKGTFTFYEFAASTILDVDPATYTFTTEAAGLQAQRKLDVTNAVYSFTGADVTFNKGYNFPVVEAVYSFTPADVTFSVTRMLIVTPASYSFTTQDAGIQAQRKLNVDEATYSFTTADAGLTAQRKLDVTNAVYSFTPQDAGLLRGLIFNVDPASYSFSTADASILAQRTLSGTEAVYLFTTQDAGLEYDQPGSGNTNFDVDPASYSFTTADASLLVQRILNADPASYSFTTETAGLRADRILNGSEAVYQFTTQDADFSVGVFESTYNMDVIRAKYRFNTKTAQLIGPKRPGLIRMYNE